MWSNTMLRVEALGVLQEALHQFGALHAVHVGGPVVDFGGGHQLAALGDAGDEHGLQVGAGGVDGGRVAGGAGTEDQDAGVLCGGGHGRSGKKGFGWVGVASIRRMTGRSGRSGYPAQGLLWAQ
jgi:hypothetical protein